MHKSAFILSFLFGSYSLQWYLHTEKLVIRLFLQLLLHIAVYPTISRIGYGQKKTTEVGNRLEVILGTWLEWMTLRKSRYLNTGRTINKLFLHTEGVYSFLMTKEVCSGREKISWWFQLSLVLLEQSVIHRANRLCHLVTVIVTLSSFLYHYVYIIIPNGKYFAVNVLRIHQDSRNCTRIIYFLEQQQKVLRLVEERKYGKSPFMFWTTAKSTKVGRRREKVQKITISSLSTASKFSLFPWI